MIAPNLTDTVCLGFSIEEMFSTIDPKHKIVRRPARCVTCPVKGKTGALAVGPVARMAYVCRQCPCNAVTALLKRHAVVQPSCEAFTTNPHLANLLCLNLAWCLISYDTWLLRWPESKRKSIIRSVACDAVDESKMSSSIKLEVSHKMPTKPRLICPYINLATQARVANLHVSFQKVCAAVLDEYELYPGIFVTFASGKNPLWYAEWMERMMQHPVWWYERDGSAWDSCMSLPHHTLVQYYMELCSPQLAESVRASWKTKVYCRTGGDPLVYILDGTQKSGCNDTTSSNTLVNLHIVAQAMYKLGLRGNVLACGDDMLAAITTDFNIDCLRREEAALGIRPEARKFYRPHDVSFVSACWLICGSKAKFVPLPGRIFVRLWWTVTRVSKKKIDCYLRSVAVGLWQGLKDVPCLREWLMPYVTDGETFGLGYWDFISPYHREMSYQESLTALSARYAITPSQVLELVGFIRSLSREPCLINHPVLDCIVEHDLSGVEDRPIGYF